MPERGSWRLDQIAGPLIISACLFFAVLANFIFRGAPPYFVLLLMVFSLITADPCDSVRELWVCSPRIPLTTDSSYPLQAERECYYPWFGLFNAVSLTAFTCSSFSLAQPPVGVLISGPGVAVSFM